MTFTIAPDDPDFDRLPRQIQARVYRANGWTIAALSDEFDVSETTVKRWTNPDYARKQSETLYRWERSPVGRQKRNAIRRQNKANTRMERRA